MLKLNLKFWIGYFLISLLLTGFYMYFIKINEYRISTFAKALVIDKFYGQGGSTRHGGGAGYYYPQYQYLYNDSIYITADHNFFARNVSVGDSVTVILKKDNPDEAILYRFVSYWISLPHLLIASVIIAFFPSAAFVIKQYLEFHKIYKNKL
jgi:hypothetical protein